MRGFPGAGKTWCMMYCILYKIQKVIEANLTDMVFKHALQIVVIHVNQFFKLPTKDNLDPNRRSEIEFLILMKNPKKIDF